MFGRLTKIVYNNTANESVNATLRRQIFWTPNLEYIYWVLPSGLGVNHIYYSRRTSDGVAFEHWIHGRQHGLLLARSVS